MSAPQLPPIELDVVRRGQAAANLLGSDTFINALREVRADAMETWEKSNPLDAEGRENCYRISLALRLIEAKLASWRDSAMVKQHNDKLRRAEAAQ